jgi:hypothetical protein
MLVEKSLALMTALFDATLAGALTWRMTADGDRDLFEALVDDEQITLEILSLQGTLGSERAFVRFVGLKAWEVFARGTEGYELAMRMLAVNVPGWAEGMSASEKRLERATNRVRQLIAIGSRST